MRSKNILLLCVLSIAAVSTTFGQSRGFVNGHLSLQPGQRVEDRYYSPGIYTPQGDTIETTFGVGGGMSLGWMFGRTFGLYFSGDWVFQSDDHDPKDSHPANTFDFDLGTRFHFSNASPLIPYLLLNYGYSNLSMKVGTPTIYIGPGGGGYSSGIDEYEGHHFALALGWELGEADLSQEVSGTWDVHFVVAQSKYADTPTISTYRLNIGYTWWVLFQ